jgi:dUTP pyrophosphatase
MSKIIKEQSLTRVLPLLFERLSPLAIRPTKATIDSAGYDLYSPYRCIIPKRDKQFIVTDIKLAIPNGCYGRIAPRSGLAWNHSIHVGAGVIDRDFRGNVSVVLFNLSDKDYEVRRGDRIAQLICEVLAQTELIEAKLDTTERGECGFGATGI